MQMEEGIERENTAGSGVFVTPARNTARSTLNTSLIGEFIALSATSLIAVASGV
jgi:hypothetical protein